MSPSLVIVGAGPRGTGFLERIAANAPELYAGPERDVHLVDPYPPGGGRIWRETQSPLLWMNSHAEDVTMFTDDSVSGAFVEARALVEARLPHPTVERTRDRLLRRLYADGAAATAEGLLAVDPADGRVLDRSGPPHPRRFALDPHTDARGSGPSPGPARAGRRSGRTTRRRGPHSRSGSTWACPGPPTGTP